jgi:DNA-binding transcriptional LysR family regulator
MRSLNLDQLRAFVEVVERGSFNAAAKELNLTQPAVTHQVQELERRFNVDLVERFGKRAYLTQAGEKLIAHARQLLEDDARAQMEMRRFDGGWLGRVRIGTSATVLMYALPPILRRLKTDHPQLEINLKAGLSATTLQMLKTNALDLGLCALPINDPAFETIPLFEDPLVAIVPVKMTKVPKKVTPAFLSRCPLILVNEESALRRTVHEWLEQAGPPAQTGDGVRSRRGDQERRRRRARLLRGSQDVFGPRTRWDGRYGDAAAQSVRGPGYRTRSTARQAQHRRHRPGLGGTFEVAAPALNAVRGIGPAACAPRHFGQAS